MTAITLDHALSRSSAKFVLASVLSVLACISVAQGVINAASFSQDFQWSPTVLLIRHGVDPYEEFLLDPSTERILLTQIPLYSHFLYLLLSPLAFIPFETAKLVWAGLNLTFCVSVFFLLRRQISRDGLVALFLVFMCSTATRNAIGNGQQSLLSLVLYAAAIRLSATGFGLLGPLVGGVAAFKYSFGVPMFFAFDRWRFVNAITYVIPSLVGVFFWSLYFGKPIIEAGALPLRLSSNVAMGEE